jgi:hypothetical protein
VGGIPPIHMVDGGKTLVRQQAPISCGPTCVLMLAHDQGILGDAAAVGGGKRGGGGDVKLTQTHELPGFLPKELQFNSSYVQNLGDLEKALATNGPAIIGLSGGGIGGHWVVADSVQGGNVTIRDPFHGWCIDVAGEVFFAAIDKDMKGGILHVKKGAV